MKALLIGAAGFVGRHVVRALASAGWNRIVALDVNPFAEEVRSAFTEQGAGVSFLSQRRFQEVPTADIDTIICIAGATSVDAALRFPEDACRTNTDIAIQLGELVRTAPRRIRTLYMSSDEVLGASDRPLPDDAPLRPTQPYAASKAAAEIILDNYRKVFDLDIRFLRSCNLVGAGQRKPKLIPVTVDSLLRGVSVPIHGTGDQRREWMAVEDLCDAIVVILRHDGSVRHAYQAATGCHRSVNDTVGMVARAVGLPLNVQHVADRLVQDSCYAMDPIQLREIGWSPRVDPDEAIVRAAQWMHQTLIQEMTDR